jgi:hypothetical protein
VRGKLYSERKGISLTMNKLPNEWAVIALTPTHLITVPTDEDDSKFHLSIEEYLHSLINLINELVIECLRVWLNGSLDLPLIRSHWEISSDLLRSVVLLKNFQMHFRS